MRWEGASDEREFSTLSVFMTLGMVTKLTSDLQHQPLASFLPRVCVCGVCMVWMCMEAGPCVCSGACGGQRLMIGVLSPSVTHDLAC